MPQDVKYESAAMDVEDQNGPQKSVTGAVCPQKVVASDVDGLAVSDSIPENLREV